MFETIQDIPSVEQLRQLDPVVLRALAGRCELARQMEDNNPEPINKTVFGMRLHAFQERSAS